MVKADLEICQDNSLVLHFTVRDTGIGIPQRSSRRFSKPSRRPTAQPRASTAARVWGSQSRSGW